MAEEGTKGEVEKDEKRRSSDPSAWRRTEGKERSMAKAKGKMKEDGGTAMRTAKKRWRKISGVTCVEVE